MSYHPMMPVTTLSGMNSIEMVHPDLGKDRLVTVTEQAFNTVWEPRGWKKATKTQVRANRASEKAEEQAPEEE